MLKSRTLIIALVVSTFLNVVGIVFTVLYFNVRKRVNAAKRESAQYLALYTAVRSHELAEIDKPGSSNRHDFVSHLDGEPDSFLIWPPQPITPSSAIKDRYTLVVYLHGMGSSSIEPFVLPDQKTPITMILNDEKKNAVLASLSYRGRASWGNEKALADINQNISEMIEEYPVKNIVLAGMSMGGCVALAYSVLAPDDIKDKLSGLLCIEGACELSSLYKLTNDKMVRDAIVQAYGGAPKDIPDKYKQTSFLAHIDRFKPDLKVAFITANRDTTVPSALTEEIANQLFKRGIQVKMIKVEGTHKPPPAQFCREALRYVLSGK